MHHHCEMNGFGILLFHTNNQSSSAGPVGTLAIYKMEIVCLYRERSCLPLLSRARLSFSGSVFRLTFSQFLFVFSSSKLSVRILLSEASVVLSDDITNPSGSMELLRLTLTKLLLSLTPAPSSLPPELAEDSAMAPSSLSLLMTDASLIEVYCYSLQVDNQLYNRTSFHFPVLLCQDQRAVCDQGGSWTSDVNPTGSPEGLEEFRHSCFLQLRIMLSGDRRSVEEVKLIFGFTLANVIPLRLH